MAMMLPISFKQSEKSLWNWILNHKNEFSVSEVGKKGFYDKKAEYDAIHTENPVSLHKRIDDLRKTLEKNSKKFNAFVDLKKLTNEWYDFYNNDETKPEKQKEFVKEIIEKNPEIGATQ